jgi:HTH-type transcriptional regulator, competence development regulator
MDQLAELRERRALTLRELAEMSGVAADTINQIELGHRKPRPSTLRKLARALEVDVEELMPPKGGAPSTPGQPERKRPIFDLVHDAVLRQDAEDRQAIARAAESGHPQGSYVTHLNEAMRDLLNRNQGDLAESYIELMKRYAWLEQEHAQLTERVEALERQLEEVGA